MDTDFSKAFPIRATIAVGNARIVTRQTLNIYDTHIMVSFLDAKGLRLVLSVEEMKKLIDAIQSRKEG